MRPLVDGNPSDKDLVMPDQDRGEGGRLLLNAYGRQCYDAGVASMSARVRELEAANKEMRAKAEAAKHRQAAAEYRAQRIVLDAELKTRAEKAEAEVASLTARIGELEQAMRDEDWHQHTSSPLSVEAVVNEFADQLARLRAEHETP